MEQGHLPRRLQDLKDKKLQGQQRAESKLLKDISQHVGLKTIRHQVESNMTDIQGRKLLLQEAETAEKVFSRKGLQGLILLRAISNRGQQTNIGVRKAEELLQREIAESKLSLLSRGRKLSLLNRPGLKASLSKPGHKRLRQEAEIAEKV